MLARASSVNEDPREPIKFRPVAKLVTAVRHWQRNFQFSSLLLERAKNSRIPRDLPHDLYGDFYSPPLYAPVPGRPHVYLGMYAGDTSKQPHRLAPHLEAQLRLFLAERDGADIKLERAELKHEHAKLSDVELERARFEHKRDDLERREFWLATLGLMETATSSPPHVSSAPGPCLLSRSGAIRRPRSPYPSQVINSANSEFVSSPPRPSDPTLSPLAPEMGLHQRRKKGHLMPSLKPLDISLTQFPAGASNHYLTSVTPASHSATASYLPSTSDAAMSSTHYRPPFGLDFSPTGVSVASSASSFPIRPCGSFDHLNILYSLSIKPLHLQFPQLSPIPSLTNLISTPEQSPVYSRTPGSADSSHASTESIPLFAADEIPSPSHGTPIPDTVPDEAVWSHARQCWVRIPLKKFSPIWEHFQEFSWVGQIFEEFGEWENDGDRSPEDIG